MAHINILNISGYELVLWLPETTIASKAYKKFKALQRRFRKLLPSRKIYPYGTLTFCVYDPRTRKEKVNDWLCDKIFDRPKRFKTLREIMEVHNFRSFFDDANGQKIWNREQITDMERKGQVRLTHAEAERESKKQKKYREEAFHKKNKAMFLEKLVEVERGKKYSTQFSAQKFSQEALQKHMEARQ